ncbi:unnamed protein product [Vicia faba]|uniref:Uncharacterized protein n=1 Tax=Vicia faba TaxID=3906 RepID=A0AAV1AV98_VICFA|nr:unnamed protein product [Vicia faba]
MSIVFPPDEDGPYIEIELDPAAVSTTIHNDADNKNSCMHEHDDDDVELEHREECELRISISSTVSVSLQKESISVDGAAEIGVSVTGKSPQPSLTTPTTTTTTANGIMMKLMIKFRCIKIRSFIASLMKQTQTSQASSSKKSITFFQCYEEDSISAPMRKSKKLMEMDLGAFKCVFNAIGMSRRSKRRTDASTSCNSTPTHEGFSKDNSIQGAIAYCKSSFGQTSDFTFSSSITSTPTRFVAYHY